MNSVTTKTRKLRKFAARMALEEQKIRERIAEARMSAGLTQAELAELCSVHKRTVEEWENTYVPWRHLEKIASVTGRSQEWLLHGEGELAPADIGTRLQRVEGMLEEVLRRLPPEATSQQEARS
jgi:transcriptional regulator with XRE-family HTH domain